MSFGITELVIILVIVLLLFGSTKLKSLGSDLGSAIKGFRSAVTGDGSGEKQEAAETPDESGQASQQLRTESPSEQSAPASQNSDPSKPSE